MKTGSVPSLCSLQPFPDLYVWSGWGNHAGAMKPPTPLATHQGKAACPVFFSLPPLRLLLSLENSSLIPSGCSSKCATPPLFRESFSKYVLGPCMCLDVPSVSQQLPMQPWTSLQRKINCSQLAWGSCLSKGHLPRGK